LRARITAAASRKFRQVATGVIPAHETVTNALVPPAEEGEIPVVFTPQVGQVVVREFTAYSVSVQNKTARLVPYVVIIVPSAAVTLARAPWVQVVNDARRLLRDKPRLQQALGMVVSRLVRWSLDR